MKPRGLTLIEVMIALSLLAIIASLAVPSFGAWSERARLKSSAETLASDLGEARFEAVRQGRGLHVEYGTAPGWCWAVATIPGCACDQPRSCQLKRERSADHAGIDLLEARAAHLDAAGGAAAGGGALFQSTRGEQLRVELTPLGHARICSPRGSVPGYLVC